MSSQLLLVDHRGVDFGLPVRSNLSPFGHFRGFAPGATRRLSRGVNEWRRLLAPTGRGTFLSVQASQNDVRTAEKVLTSLSYDDSVDEGVDTLSEEVDRLREIVDGLSRCGDDVRNKVDYLKSSHACAGFLRANRSAFESIQQKLNLHQILAILSLVAMDQEHVLGSMEDGDEYLSAIDEMASNLVRLEKFYNSLGGLVGYQVKSLELMRAGIMKGHDEENGGGAERNGLEYLCGGEETEYLLPEFLDLSEEQSHQVIGAVAEGIRAVPGMAEIYAVGGAGDRLGLECPVSGEPLPAAMLPYCGKSMMDSLLRNLQAREYLNFRITGVQSTTPVAIMTSDAKGNDWRIRGLLESRGWYGRGPDAFRLFKQPSVPVVRVPDGRWLMTEPLDLVVKPGGHGIIWKLMYDEGVFDWMINNGRKGAIVRQISNPMAGTDTTLFGLAGMGYSQDRSMGFASCERVVGASEGMNVLMHKTTPKSTPPTGSSPNVSPQVSHEYGITNIEYTEFERLGITDVAVSDESTTSCFPANTNILYVGLPAAREAVEAGTRQGGGAALPGLIFNMKKKVKYFDAVERVVREEHGGRMECMMQNLADSLMDRVEEPLGVEAHGDLSTFMVSNCRRKVTSSAKKKRKPGAGNIRQTPEGSFWDLMGNAQALLTQCGMDVPEVGSVEDYMREGPGFIFLFNPCLGPLWEVISQKIRGGRLAKGSELVLEIAEARLQDVDIEGSLLVHSTAVVGHIERSASHECVGVAAAASARSNGTEDGISWFGPGSESSLETRLTSDCCTTSDRLVFGERCGRVRMERVAVKNAGVDWGHADNVFWRHKVVRNESLTVSLNGHSEFDARDVTIAGGATFEVPDGCCMTVRPDENGKPVTQLSPLTKNAWAWEYSFSEDDHVRLKLNEEGG
ncbi:hypothetical protein BSKO_10504 [Bryopsis sp. KO-2023]|nr:hypothetical protein BSKO_10504 [Bryopsis sp. KO-2023]